MKIYIILNIIITFKKLRIIKKKIVFRIKYEFYKVLIINLELCDVFFLLQNYIKNILNKYLNDFCIVYIDDTLIYNKNKNKHIKHMRVILIRFREIEFQINVQKCLFNVIKIQYLNLIIVIKKI